MLNHFRMMAGYNAWANAQVYRSALALPEADYRADRGAFFKSVHGTLNHLLVTDLIWMHRLTGTGVSPNRLDAILFEDREALREARMAEDARITAYIDRLDANTLSTVLRYKRTTTPEVIEQRIDAALSHVFNHHTHHRGQIHALLTGISGGAPTLDLLYFQRLQPSSGAVQP